MGYTKLLFILGKYHWALDYRNLLQQQFERKAGK
jgi:hypothetical protein